MLSSKVLKSTLLLTSLLVGVVFPQVTTAASEEEHRLLRGSHPQVDVESSQAHIQAQDQAQRQLRLPIGPILYKPGLCPGRPPQLIPSPPGRQRRELTIVSSTTTCFTCGDDNNNNDVVDGGGGPATPTPTGPDRDDSNNTATPGVGIVDPPPMMNGTTAPNATMTPIPPTPPTTPPPPPPTSGIETILTSTACPTDEGMFVCPYDIRASSIPGSLNIDVSRLATTSVSGLVRLECICNPLTAKFECLSFDTVGDPTPPVEIPPPTNCVPAPRVDGNGVNLVATTQCAAHQTFPGGALDGTVMCLEENLSCMWNCNGPSSDTVQPWQCNCAETQDNNGERFYCRPTTNGA